MKKIALSASVICMFAACCFSAEIPTLNLSDSGTGADRTVTIESKGQFRLVFEDADNWGIAQWYDLVNDPEAKNNLALSDFKDPGVREAGLFQMVWYGTKPDDPKLYMHAAKVYQPKAERSFNIIENTPSRVIVESVSHPLLAAGVVENLTVAVKYQIHPDGKIYVTSKMTAKEPQTIKEWRCAVIGVCDPTSVQPTASADIQGWLRSSESQNPYSWSGKLEKYLFAYWSKKTPAPNSEWTKASYLLVNDPNNKNVSGQNGHNWNHFKRWYYNTRDVSMAAGETITQNYLIQLGTENSSVLPNITDKAVADPIANAYISNPVPPK